MSPRSRTSRAKTCRTLLQQNLSRSTRTGPKTCTTTTKITETLQAFSFYHKTTSGCCFLRPCWKGPLNPARKAARTTTNHSRTTPEPLSPNHFEPLFRHSRPPRTTTNHSRTTSEPRLNCPEIAKSHFPLACGQVFTQPVPFALL